MDDLYIGQQVKWIPDNDIGVIVEIGEKDILIQWHIRKYYRISKIWYNKSRLTDGFPKEIEFINYDGYYPCRNIL